MQRKYRVIHWATGQTGVRGLRGVIEHPELELVGLVVHSAEKEGRDAGELCGTGPVGITATRDVDSLLAAGPDCVNYMATDLGRGPFGQPKELVEELSHVLRSGVNVACIPSIFAYPPVLAPDLFQQLTDACEAGGTTFYCTGINPDVNEILLMTLSSMCQEVDSIAFSEMYSAELYEDPLVLRSLGLGRTPEEVQSELLQDFWSHIWSPLMQLMASGFGVELTEFRHSHNYALAATSIEVPAGRVEKGTVGASHHRLEGLVNGVCRVQANGYYWVGEYPQDWLQPPDPSGYRLDVRGVPDMSLQYGLTGSAITDMDSLLIATALRCVNAIPAVCDARPGVKTYRDLPHIVPPVNWAN